MSNFRCFKYRPVNKYLIDSLVNSTLYFASRDQLNDPFDSRIDIHQIIESLLTEEIDCKVKNDLKEIIKTTAFINSFEKSYKNFGICSLTIEGLSTLMWSHYAEEHRGVSLFYDFPEEYLDNPDEILGVSPVTYEEDTISNWLIENAAIYQKHHFPFVTELLKKVLTAKAPQWSYEKEGRIIRDTVGNYEIPRNMLKGVTFGLHTSESDEKLVRTITETFYDDVGFSRVVRTGKDFGIDIVEI